MAETPLQALQQIASKTTEKTSWEEVLNAIAKKRWSHAQTEARALDAQATRDSIGIRIASFAFVAALLIMATIDVTKLTLWHRWSEIYAGDIVISLARYLFVAVIVYLSTVIFVEWVISASEIGHPKWSEVKRCLKLNEALLPLKTLLSVWLALVVISFLAPPGYLKQLVYALILLTLFLTFFSILSEGRPTSVLFVGRALQRNLVLHCRLGRRIEPLIVKSCLLISLKSKFAGMICNTSLSFADRAKLDQDIQSTASMASCVIFDAEAPTEFLEATIAMIESLEQLPRRIFILVATDPTNTEERWATVRNSDIIDATFVTEDELLGSIKPLLRDQIAPS